MNPYGRGKSRREADLSDLESKETPAAPPVSRPRSAPPTPKRRFRQKTVAERLTLPGLDLAGVVEVETPEFEEE